MGFRRGDILLLREDRYATRAALIWAVVGEDAWYLPIQGVRSLERSQRHRAEIDVDHREAMEMKLPMRFPVIHCNVLYKLDPRRLRCQEPARLPASLVSAVTIAVNRELDARSTEDRLSYRRESAFELGMETV